MSVFPRLQRRPAVYMIVLAALSSSGALADSTLLNGEVPFSAQGAGNSNTQTGTAADPRPIYQPMKTGGNDLANPNQIFDNSAQNAKNGRDYKAEDAQRQANDGKKGALAAGAALVATATPMLASPIPSVQAQGAALMAKAAMEFAQAGASGNTAGQNAAQKDLLRKQYTNQTANGFNFDPNSIRSPELDQYLGQKGINSDEFYNGIVSGQYTSPDAVMNALGQAPTLPADELTHALSAADKIAAETLSKELPMIPKVGMDDSSRMTLGGGTSGTGSNSYAPLGTNAKGELGESDSRDDREIYASGSGSGSGGSREIASTDPSAGAGQGASFADVMGKFGQVGAQNAEGAGLSADAKLNLESMGIARNPGKQNIFQIAHRNYRSYEKWRDLAHR